jgi:tungstate transport system permease protein
MSDPVLEVLARSALVSGSATAVALLVGLPLGTWLALGRARGRRATIALVNTGLAVPTVVVGLVVALLLWRSGPLGSLGLIYTLRGMVIAQVVIATPLITAITVAALSLLPAELPDQLLALGASRWQMVLRLWLEARLPLLVAVMAGFGHALSEVGAATIVGGNIHGQTQVMTTAIVEGVRRGDFRAALVYAAVLLVLAFVVNATLTSVQQRGASWSRP